MPVEREPQLLTSSRDSGPIAAPYLPSPDVKRCRERYAPKPERTWHTQSSCERSVLVSLSSHIGDEHTLSFSWETPVSTEIRFALALKALLMVSNLEIDHSFWQQTVQRAIALTPSSPLSLRSPHCPRRLWAYSMAGERESWLSSYQ